MQIGGGGGRSLLLMVVVNAGFEALFVGYEKHGDGAVVMTICSGRIAAG